MNQLNLGEKRKNLNCKRMKLINLKKIEKNLMVYMSVSCVLAVQLLAQAIGGTEKVIWVRQFYCRLIAGYQIVEMKRKKKG